MHNRGSLRWRIYILTFGCSIFTPLLLNERVPLGRQCICVCSPASSWLIPVNHPRLLPSPSHGSLTLTASGSPSRKRVSCCRSHTPIFISVFHPELPTVSSKWLSHADSFQISQPYHQFPPSVSARKALEAFPTDKILCYPCVCVCVWRGCPMEVQAVPLESSVS